MVLTVVRHHSSDAAAREFWMEVLRTEVPLRNAAAAGTVPECCAALLAIALVIAFVIAFAD